jgi:hypothetical protein
MEDFEKVLKRKQDYYGKTEGSYHMAAEEYATVNYPPTPEAMGWASGVADSPNGNASSRFCLT